MTDDREVVLRADSQVDAGKTPEAGSVEAGKPLRRLQDGFAQRFGARAGALAGTELTVTSGGWTMQSYAEFLAHLAEHTCCHILAARAAAGDGAPGAAAGAPVGHVWVEIDRPLAFAMIDALLGGGEHTCIPDRALTGVERGLLRRVVDVAGASLAEAWPGPAPVAFEGVGQRALGARAGLGHVDQPVMVLAFRLAVSGQAGTLRLCLPRSMLLPRGAAEAATRRVSGPIEISVVTPEVTLSPSDLADLAAGDILTTDMPADGEVIVRVAGIPKFCGRLGTCNGRRAVTITRRINDCPPGRPGGELAGRGGED